jgi:hypothetical protein
MGKPAVLEHPMTEDQIQAERKRRSRNSVLWRSVLALVFLGVGAAGGVPMYGGAHELLPVLLLGAGVTGLFLEGVAIMDDMGKGGPRGIRGLKPAKVNEQKAAMDWAEQNNTVKETLDGILRIRRWITQEEYWALSQWVKDF